MADGKRRRPTATADGTESGWKARPTRTTTADGGAELRPGSAPRPGGTYASVDEVGLFVGTRTITITATVTNRKPVHTKGRPGSRRTPKTE